jgi:hypothetical protein
MPSSRNIVHNYTHANMARARSWQTACPFKTAWRSAMSLTVRHQSTKIHLTQSAPFPTVFATLSGLPDNLYVSYSKEWKGSIPCSGNLHQGVPFRKVIEPAPVAAKDACDATPPHFSFSVSSNTAVSNWPWMPVRQGFSAPTPRPQRDNGLHFRNPF